VAIKTIKTKKRRVIMFDLTQAILAAIARNFRLAAKTARNPAVDRRGIPNAPPLVARF
jgi:hypothetical protein